MITLDTSDPATKAIWNTCLEARREVASWPAWKRGDVDPNESVTYETLGEMMPDLFTRAKSRPRVYIAGPMLSSGDPYQNIGIGIRAGALAWDKGWTPYIPHQDALWSICLGFGDRPAIDWLEYDLGHLYRCDAVVRLPGVSAGATVEEDFAEKHGIQVFYGIENLPTFADWEKYGPL